jgi:hypothetical protein
MAMDRVAGAVEAWEQVQAMVGLETATDRAVKAGRVWESARALTGKGIHGQRALL